MKTFKFDTWGEIPKEVQAIVDQFNNQPADHQAIKNLDSEIEFVVCELKLCHGNLNKYGKDAWMSPKNGDHTWNVNVKFN